MAREEPLPRLKLEDISVDEEGRVVIANPQLAEELEEALAARPTPTPTPTNGICPTNTVVGCGPVNTVSGCGTRLTK